MRRRRRRRRRRGQRMTGAFVRLALVVSLG
jgi:hypothetical protein